MSETIAGYDEFSFKTADYKVESRAAANALRALQEKIEALQADKENLQNHISYVLDKQDLELRHESSERNEQETIEALERTKEKLWKIQEDYEIIQEKAWFLENEL